MLLVLTLCSCLLCFLVIAVTLCSDEVNLHQNLRGVQYVTDSAQRDFSQSVRPQRLSVIQGVNKRHGEDSSSVRLSFDMSDLTGATTQSD